MFSIFYSEHKAALLEIKMNKTLGHIFEDKWVEKVFIVPLWESEYTQARLFFSLVLVKKKTWHLLLYNFFYA